MTREIVVALFDAAVDRIGRESRREFERAVDSVRIGYLAATSDKARRWWDRQRAKGASRPAGLSGAALEGAIRGLAMTHPEYVVMGAA